MSLINDALKKAQKQRTGESPPLDKLPSIGGETPARIARRDKPAGPDPMVIWMGVVAAAILTVFVGGFFLVRWITTRPATPAAVVASVAPTPALASSAAPALAVPVASVASAPTAPVAAKSVATPEPVIPVVEIKPVTAPPESEAAAKPVGPAPKMDSKAIMFIDSLRVAGIRASSTDSKALMNDRVYRIGDIVEHQLGLKLSAITSGSLTFEDEQGALYTRNF